MKTLIASKELSADELVRRTDDYVVLVDSGRPVALVTRLDEDDLEWLEKELDPEFIAALAQARQQVKDGRTRSLDEVKAELGIVSEQQER